MGEKRLASQCEPFYASDYPHEPDLAEAIREFDKRKDLSDTAKRKILSDNGKRFYNMEV